MVAPLKAEVGNYFGSGGGALKEFGKLKGQRAGVRPSLGPVTAINTTWRGSSVGGVTAQEDGNLCCYLTLGPSVYSTTTTRHARWSGCGLHGD